MAWVAINTTKYTGADGGYYQGIHSTLEYNADSVTPTSIDIRFSTTREKKGYNDGYYILWNPGTNYEELFTAKPYKQNTTESHEITLTKAYDETSYTIPSYWICHCGAVTPWSGGTGVNNHKINYGTANEQTVYNYFTNSRKNFKTVVNSFSFTVTNIHNAVATDGSAPTLSMSYNRSDLTFSLFGTLGKATSPNSLESATLYYTTNGNEPNGGASWTTRESIPGGSGTTYSINNIPLPSKCNCVWAVTYCDYAYGPDTHTGHKRFDIYLAPTQPGPPTLSNSSKNNGRLTTKQNWTYSWSKADGGNNNSPVKGYWIRIWRLSKATQQWTVAKTDEWEDATKTSYTFDPTAYNFAAGDQVQFEVAAYSKDSEGNKLWSAVTGTWTNSDGKTYDLYTRSAISTVENAGVVNVKVGNSWVEGQVWVKIAQGWVEAETINVKANDGWQESQ